MPGPGERIGDAYIRVHASGENVSDEIADELDSADRTLGRKGREHGQIYGKARADAIRKETLKRGRSFYNARDLIGLTSDELADQGRRSGTEFFKGIRRSLIEAEGEDVGEEMFGNIRRGFLKDTKGDVKINIVFGEDGLEESFDIEDAFDRLETRIRQDYPALVEQAEERVIRLREASAKEQVRIHQNLVNQQVAAERRMEAALVGLDRDRRRRRAAENRDELRDFDARFKALERETKEVGELGDTVDRTFKRHPGIVEFNRDLNLLSTTMARAFGRGSRSEFLNFFGRLTGAMVRVATLPIRVGTAFAELTRSMRFAFGAAGEGLSTLGRLGKGFAGVGLTLPRLVAGLGAAAIAIGAVLIVIGPLIAGLSLFAGVVTALASTIAFGLVAALGSLVAVALPFAAGLGVLVAGIASMDDASKKMLKDSIKPLVTEFKALGVVARKGLLSEIEPTIRNLGTAFQGLRPLVKGVSEAMADVGLGFAEAMNSAGFRRFRDEMSNFLPGAVRRLGAIFRQTLGGLGGLFVGMIPFMQRVLRYLDDLTQRFQDWANSAKGQNQIESFFKRAGDSAKRLGGFLKEVGGLIGDLFSAGRGSGDSLFKSMENAVARFRAFIKSDPDILRDWFNSAENFGRALGRLVIAAGNLLDALDSPDARKIVTFFVDLLAVMGNIASVAVDVGEGFRNMFQNTAVGKALGGILKLDDAWNSLTKKFNTGGKPKVDDTDVKRTYFAVEDLREQFEALGIDADLALQGIKDDLKGLTLAAQDTATFMGQFFAGIADAFATGGEGKDKFGLAAAFKESEVPMNAFVDRMRAILGLPPIKPELDRTEIIQATIDALSALDALNLLRLFNGRPRVDPKEVKALTGDILDSIDKFRLLGRLRAVPKPDPKEVKRLTASIIDSITKFRLLAKLRATPKVDKGSIEAARRAVEALIRAFQRLSPFTGGRVDVGRSRNSVATGGVFSLVGGEFQKVQKMMAGGFANFSQMLGNLNIGESGREAIVPLDRPLGQVDPAVRALAAFAQSGGYGTTTNNRGIDVGGITIVTPTSDPRAVARETVGELALIGGYA